MIADKETTRKAIMSIQKHLLRNKRIEIENSKQKRPQKIKILDKKVMIKLNDKYLSKGRKRISIDDREKLIQTV